MKYRECMKKVSPYIPGKTEEEIKNEYNLETVIKIASNENPYGPSPKVKEALSDITCNIYPDNYMTKLRDKLAQKLSVDKDNLVFGNGSVEIIQMISRAFLDKDDNMITQLPSFSSYFSEANIQDAQIRTIKYNKEYSFDLKEMLYLIDERTKVIYITSPNNPLGTVLSKDEMCSFLELVPKSILVVIDEAYYEFTRAENYASGLELFRDFDNVCVLRTFSKAYGLAGIRIGYGIAKPEVIQNLEKVRAAFNASVVGQKGALAALDDVEYMENSVRLTHETIDYMYETLDKLNIEYIKTHGNFIMINVNENSKRVTAELLKRGIIIRDGFPLMENWIRVSIGTMEQMQQFIKILCEVM